MLFTNNNISENGFEYSSTPRTSRTNSVKVKFLDEFNRYKPKIAFAENREKITENGLYEQSVNAMGVTSRSQAQRSAEYIVQGYNLETELISFKTAHPGSYLRPGDVIDVLDNKKTIGRFAGKVLNIDVSGDGKVAYIDVDFPVKTVVDGFNKDTHKKIILYNFSGYNTLETLNEKAKYGEAVSDEEIDSIRIGQVGEYTVGSISSDYTRIQLINNPYEHISGNFTWTDAIIDARERGGELATVGNEVDQQFIQNVLPMDPKEKAWLGGYYREVPPPEKFVWVDPQSCDDDEINFFQWGEGYPKIGDTIAVDREEPEEIIIEDELEPSGMQTDSPSYPDPLVMEEMEIIRENTELPSGYNYIAVSGSESFDNHADWITTDKDIQKSYILERRTDDALLKLHDIDGTSFVLKDELNLAVTKQYKILSIKEEGDAIYRIEGIEYNSGKFGTIENNASLPTPRSPIIMNESFLEPPSMIELELLEEDIEQGLNYGIKIIFSEARSARIYRTQIFDGPQLIKTIEMNPSSLDLVEPVDPNARIFYYNYRDTKIIEGGNYHVKIEVIS
jgi:hypothetical protein